jgi:MATE family multidrug resistance protein
LPMIPAMYFFGLFDLVRRYLTCLQYPQTPMVAQIIAAPIHILLCNLCLKRYELGLQGLGIATMISYFFMFLVTAIYMLSIKTLRESLQWPNKDSFTNWGEYLRISLPSAVMMVAEGWAYSILGVFAGLIGVIDMASYTLLLNLNGNLFRTCMGIQSVACAIIGEQIGANRAPLAIEYFRLMSAISMVFMFIVCAVV